jgi:integrase
MRGSVVQKPKGTGRWYVVLDLDRDGTGRRRQKWHSGFRTKREAEKGLTALLATQDTGTYVAPQKITLGEYLADRWLPAIEATVRPTTFAGYRAHVRVYVNPALGSIPLQSVTTDQLNAFYLQLHRAGGRDGAALAPATVRRVHATLHRAFRDAMSWGYLNRNPAAPAVKPKQRSPGSVEMKTWTVADVRRFLDHVQGDRLFPAWRLAASTGLRRGELLGLRWQDVDLDTGRVSVRQTLTTVGNKVAFGEPKTARGKRNIALDGVTIGALRMWRARQAQERLTFGQAWHDTGLVFSREDGSLIHPDTFSFWFDRQVRAAGVPRIRFHDLRHTHATLALQAGVPAKVVSERLGHATVAFTLDVYSHVIPALQEDAAERIAALVDASDSNVSGV